MSPPIPELNTPIPFPATSAHVPDAVSSNQREFSKVLRVRLPPNRRSRPVLSRPHPGSVIGRASRALSQWRSSGDGSLSSTDQSGSRTCGVGPDGRGSLRRAQVGGEAAGRSRIVSRTSRRRNHSMPIEGRTSFLVLCSKGYTGRPVTPQILT